MDESGTTSEPPGRGVFGQRISPMPLEFTATPVMSWLGLSVTALALLGGALLTLRRRR